MYNGLSSTHNLVLFYHYISISKAVWLCTDINKNISQISKIKKIICEFITKIFKLCLLLLNLFYCTGILTLCLTFNNNYFFISTYFIISFNL